MDFLSTDYCINLLLSNWKTVVLLVILALLYRHYTSTYDFFKKLGIPHLKPRLILGSIGSRFFLHVSLRDYHVNRYNDFAGLPFGGYFEGRRPIILLRDPELIKSVMIKDFEHFTDRGAHDTNTPLFMKKMLIDIKGKEWKNVRAHLTPAFSSGKLRGMENLVQQCGRQMVELLKKRPDQSADLDMKDFIGRFTLEVIGSCAFGLDCASLTDPNAQFVKVAAKCLELPALQSIAFFVVLMFAPETLRYMPFSNMNMTALHHLRDVVNETKMEREKFPEKRRNDFLQIMLDAAQKEKMDAVEEKYMSDVIIQAQSIIFLFAGYETSSSLLSFACAELARRPDIQDALHEEVLGLVEEFGDDCTYDTINTLPLLDKVLLETLRMYPSFSKVDRVCTKPYTIPGTDVELEIGQSVVIPIAGIMQDEQYYPNPEVFDPERFSPEERAKRPGHLYLPFGMGPRVCIGQRFAMMSTKFAMFYLMKGYKVSQCDKTVYPIELDKSSLILLAAKGGVWMKAEPL